VQPPAGGGLHTAQEETPPLSDPLTQTLTVTGDAVHRGDVISVGGIAHQVRDIREVHPQRKRLEFEDGNVYVLGVRVTIKVTRICLDTTRRLLPAGIRAPHDAAARRHNVTGYR
jgi:hypothetical protein